MNSIQTKRILKKKKKILSLINHISAIDETIIKFSGKRSDLLFKNIESAFENALSGKTQLNKKILMMDGLSGRKYRILLNNLIKNLKNPKYLEIGSWLGSTICSACFKNRLDVTCIDNWSQNFLVNIDPKKVFLKNINKYISSNVNLCLIEKDFREINYNNHSNFNIFFYDGPHHYQDHYDSIKLVLPALANKFILIVDDWNWNQVRKGTIDAIKDENLKIVAKLEIRTTIDDSSSLITGQNSDWHQGCAFFVLEK